jgi:ribonuclease VapC
VFEAVLGICRRRLLSVGQAEEYVREFLEVASVEVIPVTAKEAETALVAFARYGKGRGHPAQLNLGDCFAYAVARNHRKSICSKDTILITPTPALRSGAGDETCERASVLMWHVGFG